LRASPFIAWFVVRLICLRSVHQMAKLVLDEYFKGAVTNTNFNLSSSYDERNCNNNMTM